MTAWMFFAWLIGCCPPFPLAKRLFNTFVNTPPFTYLITQQQATVNGQLSPELLVNYVYRLYGLDADEWEVDFFSFTGQALEIGSPRLAQVCMGRVF